MKKHILSILLVMVIVLTMTACVKVSNDTQTATFEPTESTFISTVEISSTEVTTPTEVESGLKVKPLTRSDIEKMTPEEVSNLFSELVQISQEENLSSEDMNQIGYNFYITWRSIDFTSEQQSEFETQSYEAFHNIYQQAVEQKIPLEEISSWTSLPVTDVLCKYFASSNFYDTQSIYCTGLYDLSEENVCRVIQTFFKNPLFEINSYIPCTVIRMDSGDVSTFMAWRHLILLSKSTDSRISEIPKFTYSTCGNLYCFELLDRNSEKFFEVIWNIMQNDNYDFVEKYTIFCNSMTGVKNNGIPDTAFNSLFNMAKNADGETSELIRQVANNMLDYNGANELLSVLEGNS